MAIAPPVELPTAELPTASRNQHRAAEEPVSKFWRWYWPLLLLAPLPMLAPYLSGLWRLEHYQYFPFVFITVGCLAYSRSDGKAYSPRGWFGWALIILGLGSTAVGMALLSPWFGAVGFVLLGTSCLYSLRGVEDRSLIWLALPLVMLVRVPLNLDELLIIRLQIWTTRFASLLLDLVGIAHVATGNVIELVSRELFVAEACSGIQSVFTLLFLASLLIAYKRHPLWFIPLYAAAAVLVAVLGNSLRVGTVAAADAWFALDWTEGLSHELVGYATLAVAALSLLSFDQFMVTMFHPIKINDLDPTRDPLVDAWNWLVIGGSRGEAEILDNELGSSSSPNFKTANRPSRAVAKPAAAFAVFILSRVGLLSVSATLAILSLLQVMNTWSGVAPVREPTTAYFVPPENLLEGALDSVQVVGYEIARDGENPRLGTAADIWTISDGRIRSEIILSQPYFGWHELCICYEILGWKLVDRAILIAQPQSHLEPLFDAPDSGSSAYVLANFRRDDNRFGYLLFSAITYDGVVVQPPVGLGTTAGAASRIVGRLTQGDHNSADEMMMLQLWIESPEELRTEDLQLLKKSFQQTRSTIVAAVQSTHDTPDRDSIALGL